MRTRSILILSALLLSSCGDKVAEEYAAKLSEILKSYRVKVDAKIAAEQQSYAELAKIHDQAANDRAQNLLAGELVRRSRAMTDRMARELAANPTRKVAWISDIHAELNAHAEAHFQLTEPLWAKEADAYKQLLSNMADLTVDQENLKQLEESLTTLSQPKSVLKRLQEASVFGCEVNRNLDLSENADQLAGVSKQIAAENDATKKAALEKKKTALEAAKKKLEQPCKP
jgi:hypothetical protein